MHSANIDACDCRYTNPIALGAIGWKYYIVYDVWLLFELVFCYLFIVETRNHTLEETSVYVLPLSSILPFLTTLFLFLFLAASSMAMMAQSMYSAKPLLSPVSLLYAIAHLTKSSRDDQWSFSRTWDASLRVMLKHNPINIISVYYNLLLYLNYYPKNTLKKYHKIHNTTAEAVDLTRIDYNTHITSPTS